MKTLITYSSLTGNTKKLAEGIHAGLESENIDIMPIKEVKSTEEYDTVLVGYWADKGGPNGEAKVFMEGLSGKRVGIFATLGAFPDTEYGWKVLANGDEAVKEKNEVIGRFICQGKIDPKIIERFKSLPEGSPHAVTEEKLRRYKIAENHPNEADILSAVDLFKERL